MSSKDTIDAGTENDASDSNENKSNSQSTAASVPVEVLGNICESSSWGTATQQAASKDDACTIEQRMSVVAQGQSGPNLSLTGFTCGENTLRITNSNHREGTLTYNPPFLLNQQGEQERGSQENWFRPSTGTVSAAADYTSDPTGNKQFRLRTTQTFMKWLILGLDITHDIDEDKASDRCRDILYQRWTKQLSTIHPNLRNNYLIWLSEFFNTFLVSGFFGRLSDGTVLTFEQYVIMGGPEFVERMEGYVPGPTSSLGDIKDDLTNGFTRVMAHNGRGFVSLQVPTGPRVGLQIRETLEKPTEEESMDLETYDSIIMEEKIAHLIATGAEQAAPQNAQYLGDPRLRLNSDAAKRQVSMMSSTVQNSSGRRIQQVSIDQTIGNRGDSASKKPVPGHQLRYNPPTMTQKLMGDVEPRTQVLLQNDFTSSGIVSRRNQLVVSSQGGSNQPLEIVSTVEPILNSTIAQIETTIAQLDQTSISAAVTSVNPRRKAKIVANCNAMAGADEQLLAATAPREPRGRERNRTKIEEEKNNLKAKIKYMQDARGIRQPQTLPTLSEEEKTAYETSKHVDENKMRREIRGPVMATLDHPNVPNIRRVEKNVINGELQKFANITPSIDYFLVEVTRDSDGNISITYNRNGIPVTYYPAGIIPSQLVNMMLVQFEDGKTYLPLATALILDEGIRKVVATRVYQQLLTNDNGKVFIKAILDSLRQNPETILKIFAKHKEAFFTPLTHQKQHAHNKSNTEYRNLGSTTGTHHLASIANELFSEEGGDFLKKNLEKSGMEKFISDEISKPGDSPSRLVKQILMAIMTLQVEDEDEEEGGKTSYTGDSKSGTEKKSSKSSQSRCGNIGEFILRGVIRYLLSSREQWEEGIPLNTQDAIFLYLKQRLISELSQSVPFYNSLLTAQNTDGIRDTLRELFLNRVLRPLLSQEPKLLQIYSGFLEKWISENVETIFEKIEEMRKMGCTGQGAALLFSENQNETETMSSIPPPSYQLMYDSRNRTEIQETDFPVLLEIANAVILDDSNLNFTLTCVTNPQIPGKSPTSVSLNGRVSVKRVRILDYIEFQKFRDVVETGPNKTARKKYIKAAWNHKIQNVDEVSRTTSFEDTFKLVKKRRNDTAGEAVDPGGEDDEEEQDKSSSGNSKAQSATAIKEFNVKTKTGFSRKNNGLSHNKLTADQGPRALEAVYKNIASMCLMINLGLDNEDRLRTLLSQNGFSEIEINAGAEYCLQSTTIEGIKTGGDLLQVVQMKIMGMLFSIIKDADGALSVENFGFISFDRIATIIGAIFQVPSIFISAKGRNHAYGGLNIASKVRDTTFAKPIRKQTLTPRISLFERALDCYWLGSNSSDKRCGRLHSILVAILDVLNKELSLTLPKNWTRETAENLLNMLLPFLKRTDGKNLYPAIKALMNKIYEGHLMMINAKCKSKTVPQITEINAAMSEAQNERNICFQYIEYRLSTKVPTTTVEDFCNQVSQQTGTTGGDEGSKASFDSDVPKELLASLKNQYAASSKQGRAATQITVRRRTSDDEVGKFIVRRSPGDGDCMYWSILLAASHRGLAWATTILQQYPNGGAAAYLRAQLHNALYNQNPDDSQLRVQNAFRQMPQLTQTQVEERLTAGVAAPGDPRSWGQDPEAHLISLLYDIPIAIVDGSRESQRPNHIVNIPRGNGQPLYLYWRGNHFDWLQPVAQQAVPEDLAASKQQAEAAAAEAASKQQAEAAAKQQAAAEALAKQQAALQAQLRAQIESLIAQGQGIIGYLQQTLQDMPSANDIQRIITEATAGRAMRMRDGKRRKVRAIGEDRAENDLLRLDFTLTQAIDQGQRFLALIATQGIRQNPFFGRLSNTKNPLSQKTIPNTIRDLLNQLQRIKESLGVSNRGGSRKRRHRRRKTRRKKKKRKKKTIKRRRKRGRKTRRK